MVNDVQKVYPSRIIVKFKDDVRLPYSDRVNDEINLPFWRKLKPNYPHMRIMPLITSVRSDKIKRLVEMTKKTDPSYRPINFLNLFAIDARGRGTRGILRDIGDHFDEIEYAYLEPLPSKNLELEYPNIIEPKKISDDIEKNENYPPDSYHPKTPKDNFSPKQKSKGFKSQEQAEEVMTTAFFTAEGILDQKYLNCSPMGVGLTNLDYSVDDLPGNYFFDVERGWVINHKDLGFPGQENILLPESSENNHELSNDESDVVHGTATLGVVSSLYDKFGTAGISYHSTTPYAVSSYLDGLDIGLADLVFSVENSVFTILFLLLDKHDGGEVDAFFRSVILIEEQLNYETDDGDSYRNIIVEAARFAFEVIRLATALRVTVVEPAGNGYLNFDNLSSGIFNNFLFNDSGAIIVGSAKCNGIKSIESCDDGNISWSKEDRSSYGSKISCFAWGRDVVTLATEKNGSAFADNLYRDNFGGTSSAAAIIAGVALVTQKIAYMKLGSYLNPGKLRELLSTNGIANADRENDNGDSLFPIGVMPDLERITAAIDIMADTPEVEDPFIFE